MAHKKSKKIAKCDVELDAQSNVEVTGETQVDYGASSDSNENECEGEENMHDNVETTANATPPSKPPSEDGQEPHPTITYSYDDTIIPATVTYVAYKCHSPTIREVILKVIGSEKESTASQIEFLQSVDFDEEDWLIAMHDA